MRACFLPLQDTDCIDNADLPSNRLESSDIKRPDSWFLEWAHL